MATRRIVEIGDEKLRKHCKPVEKFDLRLRILLKDMADTMYKADGVGLAAPQVGILRRAVVVDIGEGLYEMV
ncbi:MAG: peptide deformylase, partial [Clostridiales bacterium]|nr:peptide deformylase [Clostridiales bacterium]